MRRAGIVFVVALWVGCGSGSSGSPDGAAGASSFVVKDTTYTRLSVLGDDKVNIFVANIDGVCGLFTSTTNPPGRAYDMIAFELDVTNGTVTTGTKTVVDPGSDAGIVGSDVASAFYSGIRSCNTRYGGYATGTLTLTTLDDTHVVGSYDLDFASGWPFGGQPQGGGGHTQGSFDAPACDLMGNLGFITCN